MGDISEMRGLVVVGCFLGLFVLLASWMPPEFSYSTTMTNSTIPEYYEATDTLLYNTTVLSVNFTKWDADNPTYGWVGYWGSDFDYGDVHFGFGCYNTTNWASQTPRLLCDIQDDYGFFVATCQWKHGTDELGDNLLWSVMDSVYSEGDELDFVVSHSGYPTFTIILFFNETAYSSPSQAGQNDALSILVGQTIDQLSTTTNAWGLLWNLLTFQTVQGIDSRLSLIIAIPFWIAVAYMLFIFALRIIGAVFGGGGA